MRKIRVERAYLTHSNKKSRMAPAEFMLELADIAEKFRRLY